MLDLYFRLKNKNGSALIIVLVIVIVMSLVGLSLITLAFSEFNMSIFYSDLNKSYFIAEAGAEQVAKTLDQKVTEIQNTAREGAIAYAQELLINDPKNMRNTDETVNYGVISNYIESKYFELFNEGLQYFNDVSSLDKRKLMLDTSFVEGTNPYKDIAFENALSGRVFLESCEPLQQKDENNNLLTYEIAIRVRGYFNGYNKTINATFKLLPKPEERSVPYSAIPQYQYNKVKDTPNLFKKALVARKNIFAIGGSSFITGDVSCFGTIPQNNGVESMSATWDSYGGIIAGINEDIASKDTEFDFDKTITGSLSTGSINIDGNVSTFGYIHSLYSNSANISNITIKGNTFARSVRSEERASFSTFNLNKVYTMDNIQIDSNGSSMQVRDNYYGFMDVNYSSDGSVQPKKTSSIVVNGDSELHFEKSIYVGGSTFFSKYYDENSIPYMSGISAMKSSKRAINAFSNDKLYWDENKDGNTVEVTPRKKNYNGVNLIIGRESDPDEPPLFSIAHRAMHFKGIWSNLWKDDDIYSSYINTSSISIATTNEKLNGYSNGAVIANGKVYSPYDFNELHDPNAYAIIQKDCIKEYHNAMEDFIEDETLDNGRINYTTPVKELTGYVNSSFVGPNMIKYNTVYPVPNTGIIYYGTGNKEIYPNNGSWYISGELLPLTEGEMKGIIFIDGNVYIHGNFNLKGTIIASGNIVLLGNSTITYDGSVVESLLRADINTKGFFNLLKYEIPTQGSIKSQRIIQKNIQVTKWNEE